MTEATVPSKTTLHCALELSKSSWLLAIQFPDRPQPSLYRIKGGDAAALLAQLLIARDRCAKATGEAPSTITLCYEIGYDAFWLARFLIARGIECWVVDPASLKVNRRGRRAKTDRIDVGMLVRVLIGLVARRPPCVVGCANPQRRRRRCAALASRTRPADPRENIAHQSHQGPAVRPRHPRHQYQDAVQKAEARRAFDGRWSAIAVSAQSRDRAGDLTPCDRPGADRYHQSRAR